MSKLAEKLISEFTRGIRNAMHRQSPQFVCPGCDLAIPRYPGRYPTKCPDCGEVLEKYETRGKPKVKEDLQNSPVYSEYDAWDAVMRRIPQDRIGGEDDDQDEMDYKYDPSTPDKERIP